MFVQRIKFVLFLSLLALVGCHSAAPTPVPVVNPNLPAPLAKPPVKSAPPVLEQVVEAPPQAAAPVFKVRDRKGLPGELYVLPRPENARVRVMNIQPKFVQGMRLPAGRYQIEVTAPGYQPSLQWVTLDAGRMLRYRVTLKPE